MPKKATALTGKRITKAKQLSVRQSRQRANTRQPLNIEYGGVYITSGAFRGRIMYYDDDEDPDTAICYVGHPVAFAGSYAVPRRSMCDPSVSDLLKRTEGIQHALAKFGIDRQWPRPAELHALWAEKDLIGDLLYERRTLGEMAQVASDTTVFLCHSSSDKGFVRMVNDDLRRLGAKTWLDENNIKVGDSLVDKISTGLRDSQFLAIFISPGSVKSQWMKREWQSFLSRQLAGSDVTILPILIEKCEVPAILADLKYADFSEDYYSGLKTLSAALT